MRSTKPMLAAKISNIVMAILCVTFGVSLIIGKDDLILSKFGTIIGVYMIIYGGVRLFGYFSKDLFRLAFQHDMASGIMTALVGIFVLFKPDAAANYMHIILGALAVGDGLLKIQISIDSKKFGIKVWWLIFAVAILCCLVGISLLFKLLDFVDLMTLFVGILLITEGVLNLLVVLLTVKIIKHQKRDDNENENTNN